MMSDIFAQFELKEKQEQKLVQEAIQTVSAELLQVQPPNNHVYTPGHKTPYNLQELARKRTEEAFNTILEIMNDRENEAATRLEAAKHILDRGWGKASVRIEAKTVQVNVHEVLKELGSKFKNPPRLGGEEEVLNVVARELDA